MQPIWMIEVRAISAPKQSPKRGKLDWRFYWTQSDMRELVQHQCISHCLIFSSLQLDLSKYKWMNRLPQKAMNEQIK